jgi:ParB-like chromosome segregation protein Spo0J
MNVKDIPIKELTPAEYNPRYISDDAFDQLAKSLQDFDAVEPIVINTHKGRENTIIGGHQRIKAAEALGWDTFPCVEVDLPLKRERELNVKLNKTTGEFDFDKLANFFDADELTEWGFSDEELFGDENFSEKNEEIDIDDFDDEMKISLSYTEDEYWVVTKGLAEIAGTPEQAVWKLLGNE